MSPPWLELTLASDEVDAALRAGRSPRPDDVDELRSYLAECRLDADHQQAICFHEASAVVAEAGGDLQLAIQCRKRELTRIKTLLRHERDHPEDASAMAALEELLGTSSRYGPDSVTDRMARIAALEARL